MSQRQPDYVTGTGQKMVGVHKETRECRKHGCPIHAPSQHHMRDWPTNWRSDRRIMERICPCGVGHPDPDHLAYVERTWGKTSAQTDSLHGCCGHCDPEATRWPPVEWKGKPWPGGSLSEWLSVTRPEPTDNPRPLNSSPTTRLDSTPHPTSHVHPIHPD